MPRILRNKNNEISVFMDDLPETERVAIHATIRLTHEIELLLNFAMFFVGVSAGFLSGILIVLGVVSAASKEFADGSGALLFVMITLLLTTILGGFSGYFIDSYTAWNYLPGKVHQLASEVSRSPTAAEFVREYARTHPHWAKNVALHHPKLLAATP